MYIRKRNKTGRMRLRSRRAFRRFVLALLLVLLVLGLVSCPEPIDMALVRAVEDTLDPVVKITSPLPGARYSSTVLVSGTVTDDSIEAGDGQGLIKSIGYDVANDDFRRGRIIISSTTGEASQDTSGGTGVIDWDNDSGAFGFGFTTIETAEAPALTGPLSISVTVTDVNGNATTLDISMAESLGPYIVLLEPGDRELSFREGITTLDIFGTVSNSQSEISSASELKKLSWYVPGKTWKGVIILDPDDPNCTPYDPVDGRYETKNQGSQDLVNIDFFFDPDRYYDYEDPSDPDNDTKSWQEGKPGFQTSLYVPWGAGSLLPLVVSAEDYNGHVTEYSVILYSDVSGPEILSIDITPENNGKYYYNSNNYSLRRVVVSGVMSTESIPELAAMYYKVDASALPPQDAVEVYKKGVNPDFFDAGGNFSFEIDTVDLTPEKNYATLTIMARNDIGNETKPVFQLWADGSAPVIGAGTMTSNNAFNDAYAKVGDQVTLTFSIDDAGQSGIDFTAEPPVVSIAGLDVTGDSTYTYSATTGLYSVSYTMPSAPAKSDAYVTFTMDAEDRVGNVAATVTEAKIGSQKVMFYEGAPSVVSTSVASNNANIGWAKTGDEVILSFSIGNGRDLHSDPTVSITGDNVPTNPDPAHPIYAAVYGMQLGDTEGAVPFSITITDAAGNSNSATPKTTTDNGSSVTFDKTAPAVVPGPTAEPAVEFSPPTGLLGIGDDITVTVRATDNLSPGQLAGSAILINGRDTLGNFAHATDMGSGIHAYTVTYRVVEDHPSRLDSASVPVSIVLADMAGNTNTAYASAPAADLCPAIDAERPNVGSAVFSETGWLKAGSSTDVTITATDNMTAGLTVNSLTVNGSSCSTSHTQSGNDYTFTYTVGDGDAERDQDESVPIVVQFEDAAGNTGSASLNPAAIDCPGIDRTGPASPSVTAAPHSNQNSWYQDTTPVFSWSAPSDLSGIAGYSYVLDGASGTTPDTTVETSGTSFSPAALSDGNHYFHIRALDNAGNWGATEHYRVRIDTASPGAPSVSSSSHPNPSVYENDNTPSFSWTEPGDLSGIAGYSYTIDGSASTTPNTTINTTGTSATTGAQSDGTRYFHVRARDNAGNWGPADHYQVRIDTAGPSSVSISSSSHPSSSTWYTDDTPSFTWTAATDSLSGLAGYSYVLDSNASTAPNTSVETSGTSFTASSQSDGVHYFHVRAVDNAGNGGSTDHYMVRIDDTNPGAPSISSSTHPDPGQTYTSGSISFSWTTPSDTSGIDGYSYVFNGSPSTTPDTSIDTGGTSHSESVSTDGTYYLHVRAVDNAGNWGGTDHFKVQIDIP